MGISNHLRKVNWCHFSIRILQVIIGCGTVGYYGQDLSNAAKASKYADGKWVFAVTVGGLAALTALLFSATACCIQFRSVAFFFIWEWVLTILYAVLSGIFGSMYLHEKVEMEGGIARMKTAAVFDIIGTIIWFLTAVFANWWFFSEKRKLFRPSRRVAVSDDQWHGNAGLARPEGSGPSGLPVVLGPGTGRLELIEGDTGKRRSSSRAHNTDLPLTKPSKRRARNGTSSKLGEGTMRGGKGHRETIQKHKTSRNASLSTGTRNGSSSNLSEGTIRHETNQEREAPRNAGPSTRTRSRSSSSSESTESFWSV